MRHRIDRSLILSLAVAAAMGVQGCLTDEPDEKLQLRNDMYVQPSFRHNEDPRPQPQGTVMTGTDVDQAVDSAQAAKQRNPLIVRGAAADTARGLFLTYCSPCHGVLGKGDGPVAAKFQAPPNLTIPPYKNLPDGLVAFVARNGFRMMPPHKEMTTVHERWLIVAYLRGLQQ